MGRTHEPYIRAINEASYIPPKTQRLHTPWGGMKPQGLHRGMKPRGKKNEPIQLFTT